MHGLRSVRRARELSAPLPSAERPVLYAHTCCPYAQRVLMGMLHNTRVPFDFVQVDLSHKPAWFTWQVNPRGLVPAVDYRGSVVVESIDILRWLDGAFGSSSSEAVPDYRPLTPADAVQRRRCDALVDDATPRLMSAGLSASAGASGYAWSVGRGGPASPAQLSALEAALRPLVDALADGGGPFLCGSDLSIADAALFPFVERFDTALSRFSNYEIGQVGGGAIGEWMLAVRALPAGALSSPAPGRLVAALEQHQSLDWFDYSTVDVEALHPHLLDAVRGAV
jgi:glutathione S-transferase